MPDRTEIGSPVSPNKMSAIEPRMSEVRLRKSSTVEGLTEQPKEKMYTATYFGSDFNYATQ